MFAVACAPVATAFQMRNSHVPTKTSEQAAMPCHGSQASATPIILVTGSAEQMTAADYATDVSFCTCTPWCHAALAAAVEFNMAFLAPVLLEPIPHFGPNITADVPPLLKPPNA